MKRRRLAVIVLSSLLAFQAALAFAQSKVIYEVIAASELVDVDLEIPDSVQPGYHQMLVEVLDDNGVVRSKVALFCKDTDGSVNLDNLCPGLKAAGISGEENIVTPKEVAYGDPFDPQQNPAQTQGLLVTLFALATVLLTNRKPDDGSRDEEGNFSDAESEEDRGSLESVNAGSLPVRADVVGVGDLRRKKKGRNLGLDPLGTELARIFNKVSYILARVTLDGRYLRAIFGSKTWLLSLISLYCAWRGVNEINREALPLNYSWLLIIMVIAIFDSFAGFYASLGYFFSILFAGNFNTFTDVITVLGTMIVMYAPALIAGTVRPMQRTVDSKVTFWERLTDYAVGILLSAMAVKGLVTGLSGLSGVKLEVADQAGSFAIAAAISLAARMILEEIAWYRYPERLRKETITISNGSRFRVFAKSFMRFFLFVAFTLPFVGPTAGFLIGVSIYLLGQIIPRVNLKLPRLRIIGQFVPSGIVSIVTLSLIGGFVSYWLASEITDPGHLIEATFWVMALPGFTFALLNKFKGEPYLRIKAENRLSLIYVLLGLSLYGALVAITAGVDLSEKIRGIF